MDLVDNIQLVGVASDVEESDIVFIKLTGDDAIEGPMYYALEYGIDGMDIKLLGASGVPIKEVTRVNGELVYELDEERALEFNIRDYGTNREDIRSAVDLLSVWVIEAGVVEVRKMMQVEETLQEVIKEFK